jgi:DNA-binding MarR family transcriptional regulator
LSHYTPSTYRVRTSIGYLIRRASNVMISRIECVFSTHEITFVQWLVLMQVRDGIARTAAEIGRDMCYDSGALTRVIDQLSERGFIERRRSTEDRRVAPLFLTDAGLAIVESLVPVVVDCLNASLAGFTADEVSTLTNLLTRLLDTVSTAPLPCDSSLPEIRNA